MVEDAEALIEAGLEEPLLHLYNRFHETNRHLLLTAEYESRFTSSEVSTREVGLIGDTPREMFVRERLTLHESRLRFGAEYKPLAVFAVRGGLDRLTGDDFGGVRPSAGFMVEQALGSLVARAEYAFVLEPYALGTMHLVTLRFFL